MLILSPPGSHDHLHVFGKSLSDLVPMPTIVGRFPAIYHQLGRVEDHTVIFVETKAFSHLMAEFFAMDRRGEEGDRAIPFLLGNFVDESLGKVFG